MGPRIFTVREATALIPDLDGAFTALDDVRQRLRKLKGKMDLLEMLWGEELQSKRNPDHKEYKHYLDEAEQLKKEYEAATKRIADHEVVLKSVENGLVDFYGVIENRLVFLCWKRGEKEITHFHHLEEGFAGRREIAEEYRS